MSEDQNNLVQELTRKLNNLQVQSIQLQTEIIETKQLLLTFSESVSTQQQTTKPAATTSRSARRSKRDKKQPTVQASSSRNESSEPAIEAGDYVEVLNPKRNQGRYGEVINFTRDRKARVQTTSGTIIRATFNLKRTQRPSV